MLEHEVVVVGAGLAGMRAAIEAHRNGADVAIVSKLHPVRSHSGAAQGGINAALGNAEADEPSNHTFDTVKGADYIGDQDAIEAMCNDAPRNIYELEHMGCVFTRNDKGQIAQRPFGGASFPRTCFAADITGHVILHTLYEQVLKANITVYEEWFVTDLVVEDGRVQGVIAWDIVRGGLQVVGARAVILATGGAGRVFYGTTNAHASTGDGMILAYRAGAALKDMEFMQFHPTTLASNGVLVTEGARGEGAYLRDKDGERFMSKYAPNKLELASRDVVSRAEATEIQEGRGKDGNVFLDLTHLGQERIMARLPQIRELAIDFAGVDPVTDWIPIRPGAHYTMGGVDVDKWGKSRQLEGLYAAGECSCVSVHGANRLGGNSLLETVVFGRRSGEHAANFVRDLPAPTAHRRAGVLTDAQARIRALLDSDGGERAAKLRAELAHDMQDHFGVFRTGAEMEAGLEKVQALGERFRRGVWVQDSGTVFNNDLTFALEVGYVTELAQTMAVGAIARTESRGAHSRLDYTERDDENWMKHTLAIKDGDGVRLDYSAVTVTRFAPQVRSY